MGDWTRRRGGPRPNTAKRASGGRSRSATRLTRRHRRIGYVLLWVVTTSLCGWGLAAAYREAKPLLDDWLAVREITVTGVTRLAKQEVLTRLALPGGTTQLTVRVQDLAGRLTSHPWIKAARVERRLPHGLVVHVRERLPAVALRSPLLNLLLDEEGQVLSAVSPAETQDLPVLVGVDPNRLLQGDAQARQAVQAGIRLALLLRDSFEDQPEIDVSRPNEVVAYAEHLRFQFATTSLDEQWTRYRAVEGALRTSTTAAGHSPGCTSARLSDGDRPVPDGCPEIDLRYQSKVIVRERG